MVEEVSVPPEGPTVNLDGRFVISAEEVAQLVKSCSSVEALLVQLIPQASQLARPGISNYHVGAAALGGSGAIYMGANLEFRNSPLFQSVHAEQFVLVNALSHGETSIVLLAVSAAPCGHCRQFYSELSCADTVTFMFGSSGVLKKYNLAALLPGRFTPADLLPDSTLPLLMEPQNNLLQLSQSAEEIVESRQQDSSFQEAAARALEEAVQAYAHYTRCPSGAAIISLTGVVSGGRYIESAAYNPSLPPLQAAVINAVINKLPDYTQIAEVVFVELEGAMVRHVDTIRLVLQHIAPAARLTVLTAVWSSTPNGTCSAVANGMLPALNKPLSA